MEVPDQEACDRTDDPEIDPLDATSALVLRPCTMAAYQGDALVYILARDGTGAPKPVMLTVPGLPTIDGRRLGPDMTEPSFDPNTGQLSSEYKGRGIADCGMFVSWVWHAGRFRLLGLNDQDQCGGSEAGDWPTLYRTANPSHDN